MFEHSRRSPVIGAVVRLLAICLVLVIISCGRDTSRPTAGDNELTIYTWSDYVPQQVVDEFTRQTGIRVRVDVYDSNDVLDAKLTVGHSGYDLVFPSAMPFFGRQVAAGEFRPLNLAAIPNARGVDPQIMRMLQVADPTNRYGVPYMMAGTGIGVIRAKFPPATQNAPVGSLALLFNPGVARSLSSCGISVLDEANEVFPAALSFAGHSPTSRDDADLDVAARTIAAARPYWREIHSSNYISALASGSICVAQGWTGDLVQARQRALDAHNGVTIDIFLPREGASFNVDVMAIPADAPHPQNAERFINFVLDPHVIAQASTAVGYANAVPAAKQFMPAAIVSDPAIYPPSGLRLFVPPPATADYERRRNALWERLKSRL